MPVLSVVVMVKHGDVDKALRLQSTSESICRTIIIPVVISKKADVLDQAFRFCFCWWQSG